MVINKNKKRFIVSLLVIFIGFVAFKVSAYQPLVDLPNVEGVSGDRVDIALYLRSLIPFIIGIASVLAVLKIVIGGIKYISSSANPGLVGEAKKSIMDAVMGLILILVSWLILNTINPDLINFNLSELGKLETTPQKASGLWCYNSTSGQQCFSNKNSCDSSATVPNNLATSGCNETKTEEDVKDGFFYTFVYIQKPDNTLRSSLYETKGICDIKRDSFRKQAGNSVRILSLCKKEN